MLILKLLIAIMVLTTAMYRIHKYEVSYIGPVHYHTQTGQYNHIDPNEVLEKHPYTFCPPEYRAVSPYEIKQVCNNAKSSITCWHHYAWCKQI